ncbi:MAG: Septum formation initiator [Parcubacteria group bacterium GW2011_GWC2_42_6]|nr:MAG: Septum formation initiator [Parcubacteria group bacterium GW2011_GWA2_42_11]KKS66439.1 MAG: Septum formation initiator [Parcubacteria group bacterium GW2011_GWC2_42_6]
MPGNKFKRIFTSRFFLFALLLAVIWTGIVLINTHYKKNQLKSEVDNLKSEIEKIDKNNEELAELINYFGSSDFLEKEAKEKLNLKKEGENVIMVPKAAISGASDQGLPVGQDQALENGQAKSPENNFIKWWQYFFGR